MRVKRSLVLLVLESCRRLDRRLTLLGRVTSGTHLVITIVSPRCAVRVVVGWPPLVHGCGSSMTWMSLSRSTSLHNGKMPCEGVEEEGVKATTHG